MTKKEFTQLSYYITGFAIKVHKILGPGLLLESVYQKCLRYELQQNEYSVEQNLRVPVLFDNLVLDTDLRLNLLGNNCVVVELKTVEYYYLFTKLNCLPI